MMDTAALDEQLAALDRERRELKHDLKEIEARLAEIADERRTLIRQIEDNGGEVDWGR